MRNVYLVTSVIENKPGVTSGPCLGLFSTRKKAEAHFGLCLEAAMRGEGKLCWDIDVPSQAGEMDVRRALISYPDQSSTTLAIAKWKVG